MKALKLLAFFLTIHCTAQSNYIAFTAGTDIDFNLITEFTMVAEDVQVEIGYDAKPKLDFSRMYIGVGYQFPLFMYPNGNEIRTTFAPTIQPSLINRTGTWGGAFTDKNNSCHLSLALNLAFIWEITDNFMIGYSLNGLPRTDLKSKFPKELWSQKIILANTPVEISSFLKLTYKINY